MQRANGKFSNIAGRGLALTAALALPVGSWAAMPDYDFVEAYYSMESELAAASNTLDGDGFGMNASMSLTDRAFVEGRYDEIDTGNTMDSADTRTWSLNAGMHAPLQIKGGTVDIYGTLGYEDLDLVELADGEGPAAEVGARWRPTDELEFGAFVRFADYGEVDIGGADAEIDGRFHGFTAAFHVTPALAVTGTYRTGDYEVSGAGASDEIDRDDIRLGLRWHFGGPFER